MVEPMGLAQRRPGFLVTGQQEATSWHSLLALQVSTTGSAYSVQSVPNTCLPFASYGQAISAQRPLIPRA